MEIDTHTKRIPQFYAMKFLLNLKSMDFIKNIFTQTLVDITIY